MLIQKSVHNTSDTARGGVLVCVIWPLTGEAQETRVTFAKPVESSNRAVTGS